MLNKLVILLIQMVEIYSFMLLAWVIGSWFPRFTITKFFQFLDQVVKPYVSIFRSVIPPLGGFDFSVIVAFIVLHLVSDILRVLGSKLI